MSHRATNWAIAQRGLKPGAKLVLWHLADAHNPHYGCFPSQERLAHECEMSRSTVNAHLSTLEERGLIRRIQARCEQTNRQLATRYVLGFELDEQGGDSAPASSSHDTQDVVPPCPKTGHGNEGEAVSENGAGPCPKTAESRVRNSDSNPVKEPITETRNSRESAQARDVGEGQEGESGKRQAQDLDGEKPSDGNTVSLAVLRRTFREAFVQWPTYKADPEKPAFDAWQALTDDERAEAARLIGAYVQSVKDTGRKHVCAFGAYLREKRWQRLDEAEIAKAAKAQGQAGAPSDYATGGGPVFNAYLVGLLLSGPDMAAVPQPDRQRVVDLLDSLSMYLDPDRLAAKAEALGVSFDENGDVVFPDGWEDVERRRLIAENGWKRAKREAEERGARFGPRWHAMKEAMEAVPVGSEALAAWRRHFAARDWPWLFDRENLPVAWLPKLPDGNAPIDDRVCMALDAFAARLDAHAPQGESDDA